MPDGAFNVKVNIAFPEEIEGKYDMGLIAVRSNYTPDALRTVLPHLTDNGLLVSMQNGINPPLLAEKVGIDRTIGMTYDEKMGLQFGETLVVQKNGCESLNAYPRQWVTCQG